MTRPLLVAEAPARGMRPGSRALDGPSGDRLASYAGMTREQLLDAFETVNLVGRFPGQAVKGTLWPAALARRCAARKKLRGVCVLMGRRVACAYGLGGLEWFEWAHLVGRGGATWRAPTMVAVVPHPSGICREYNESHARLMAAKTLREALLLSDSAANLLSVPDLRIAGNDEQRPGKSASAVAHRARAASAAPGRRLRQGLSDRRS